MNELIQMAGIMEAKTIIRGNGYVIKPLRIRELADIDLYNTTLAKSNFEMRAYEVYKHLRDNEGMTPDFVLDLYPDEFRALTEAIGKLYPEKPDNEDKDEKN
jgi:hypothetical protein